MPEVKKTSFNPRIFWATRQQLALAAMVGVVSVGLVFMAIIPQFNSVMSLREDLVQEEPALDKLRQKLVQLDSVSVTPEFSQVDIVNDALPSKKPVLELLTSLNTAAFVNDITIDNYQLAPGDIATQSAQFVGSSGAGAGAANRQAGASAGGGNQAVDSLTLTMEASGAQQDVRQFLTLIEKITPFTTITQLSVEVAESNLLGEPEVVSATITTETYFFTQSIRATTESPLPVIGETELDVLDQLAAFVENDLPEQTQIRGGGAEDLFGVDELDFGE